MFNDRKEDISKKTDLRNIVKTGVRVSSDILYLSLVL